MEIMTKKVRNAMVVSVKGRMDAISSSEVEKELSELIAGGEKAFVIDFAELDYISSAGLRVILATTKTLREKEGNLMLSTLRDIVDDAFRISGFNTIIPIYESVESALAQVQ